MATQGTSTVMPSVSHQRILPMDSRSPLRHRWCDRKKCRGLRRHWEPTKVVKEGPGGEREERPRQAEEQQVHGKDQGCQGL